MVDDVLKQLQTEIDQTLGSMKNELGKLRTGRATISVLDSVRVNYYGTPTPLNQCAQLTVADARMILVKPFSRDVIKEIEKGIMNSDLGVTPQNDGEIIRLSFPQLTEERRRDLVKQAKHKGEEAKIAMRNHRRESNDMLKEFEKDKVISQDDLKKALEKVQTIVDAGVSKIEETLASKEKEIMSI